MTLEVTYAHDRSSREPRPMKAQQIWSVADQVRRQLVPSRPVACLDLERLIRAAGRMMVNGIAIAAHWDFERSVHDGRGREALGVTEADPALPGIVLISLNAKLIAERDYLKRSTLAHEFGHALFDGPSMLRQAGQPAFAMVTPDEGHLAAASRGRAGMDWREFRANEFMGALLAPRALLHRELVRRALALRQPLRNAGEGVPLLRAGGDPHRVVVLLPVLAERFGVSSTFIEYRLYRYALVQ
jgi:hypothetical protein